MTTSATVPMRLCIYGDAPPTQAWLDRVANEAAGAVLTAQADIDGFDTHAVLRTAARIYPGEHLILLRADTALPPFWYVRMLRALESDNVLVATPLDNLDDARAPVPESASSDAGIATVDALCNAYGRGALIDWPAFSPLLSAWHGERLRTIDTQQIHNYTLPQTLAPLRAVLLDHLYVADPARNLRGPKPLAPGADPLPPSPLGELREAVAAALASKTQRSPAYLGLDAKPVVLHILHGWGGGAERFVRDLSTSDEARHHLVLVARGTSARKQYGETLELLEGTFASPALRRLDLPNPIRSTTLGDAAYRAFLQSALDHFHIEAVIVSSLIGHSLDALRSGLPTILVTHDFYPLWPLLHRDFGDTTLAFDDAQLVADLQSGGADFEFAERDPTYWRTLRSAYVGAVFEAHAQVVAPSRAALANLDRLEPRLSALPQTVIAHGIGVWPADAPLPPPARTTQSRLRLVVPGRIRRGKGADLLHATLPKLRAHAEIFLLGAGAEGMQFFGETGVHVVLDYRHAELPALLARIRPDAALLLPTVAETFSYMLSELASLQVPTLATRVGALAERIDDGVDGWLIAPNADALAAKVALMDGARAQIDAVRATLASRTVRTLAAMASDYNALLPQATKARTSNHAIDLVRPDSLLAVSRAAIVGATQRKLAEATARIVAQESELARRADWGIELEREIRKAHTQIERGNAEHAEEFRVALGHLHDRDAQIDRLGEHLQLVDKQLDERNRHIETLNTHVSGLGEHIATQEHEIDERNRHIETLNTQIAALDASVDALGVHIAGQDTTIAERTQWATEAIAREDGVRAELGQLNAAHAQLHNELDERTRWAQSLDTQLEAMRSSTSWRITGPLRYLTRKLRGARARAAYQLARVKSALSRTRGSLVRRGTGATIARIGEEFRRKRQVPSAPLAVVDPPLADFVAFRIPTSKQPQVSIVIPVYNKIDYTVACLRSLAEHAGPASFEVIVVDDGSSDLTQDRLAQIDGLRAQRNKKNLGFVGSCNAGAKSAKGEFVLFLNNDTVVTAGWLEALVRCFEEEPDAGLVGAKLIYPDGRLQEAGGIVFRDGSGWNYGRFDDPADPRYEFRREADYCSGAAIILRRDFFNRLGGFDQRYAPAYYEDTDLAFAVRAAGKKVLFEPRSQVVHFEGITAGTDTGAGVKQYQVVNREKFLEKWKHILPRQPAPIDSAKLAPAAANFRLPRHVLIVDSYTPTPDQDSGSLRMLNLMRLLQELGYRVSFLPDNRAHAGKYTEALQALGIEALYHPYVNDPSAWLRENGATLDVVVLSRHYVAANYVGLVRLYAPQAKLIFDTVDLHYLREERTAALENKPELARVALATKASELGLMRDCDLTFVVSAVEQELLAREAPEARVEVLSNVHEIYGRRREFGARHDLVFVGGFQHPPNIDAVQWFTREVFPLVRARAPQIQFHIIGSKVTKEVTDLAADGVIVHGFVEDIAPFMDASRLSIAPLRVGAGVKGKVNMAMSYGLPVVATGVAVEGMHVRSGEDVMVADTPQAMAEAILQAYSDEALWNTLSTNGLENVRRHFSFDAARAALESILPK